MKYPDQNGQIKKSNATEEIQDIAVRLDHKDLEIQNLRSELVLKDNKISELEQILSERENSLSWKLSQYYGRYFLMNSHITKLIRYFINKFIPKNNSTILRPLNKSELSALSSLKLFLKNNSGNNILLIFSGVKFIETEGQRSMRLAQNISKKNFSVIFASFRWSQEENFELGEVYPNVFQIPIDVLMTDAEKILDMPTNHKALLIEFPHPSLLELLSLANSYRWTTIYDVIDDWDAFHDSGHAIWYDKDIEAYVTLNSDIITAVSPVISDKLAKNFGAEIKLLPNALSREALDDESQDIFHIAKPKGEITIGYFGHLTSAWFDWDLVKMVAIMHPEWVFQIIGYGEPNNLALPNNVCLLGKVRPNELKNYSKHWNVAIIPFKKTALSMAADPIKLYEYIYLGLPVVVTGISHIGFHDVVKEAKNMAEFEKYIQEVSSLIITKDLRQKFIEENTWEKRVNILIKLISEFEKSSSLKRSLKK